MANGGRLNVSSGELPAGSVLQVVSTTTSTEVTTTSASFQTTGLTATITPTSTSSKILILAHTSLRVDSSSAANVLTIFRGTTAGTDLGNFGRNFGQGTTIGINHVNFLDSPNTASAQTYTLAFRASASGNLVKAQDQGGKASMTLLEVAG